ncbi:MAG: preprotein translocase subunit SecA [Clostridiales bacterium]|nr:preprotein translocase subunit SecA [Clostridiales bacterium]
MEFIKKLLAGSNDKEIKKLRKIVDSIEALEPKYQKMTDDELRGQTQQFKQRVAGGESLDAILPEAFAVAREGAVRSVGMRPFPVQLLGGIVLHQGRIAEMRTGEGKTLTAALPAYLNALTGKGVHIVTVNDYLAKFHSEWMGKIYRFLGLSVGLILNGMDANAKRAAYNADITYGTNSEIGFDYLRDNMAIRKEQLVQRDLNFAIIDEVDSILIDEARTPLIISGAGEKSTDMYARVDRFVSGLKLDTDFVRDEKDKTINLTEDGAKRAEAHFGVENLSAPENNELHHHILVSLRANFLMKRDVDYVVKDGQVLIVDEFTGRIMNGRRFSDGVHQAIEAKEHVKVERENRTLATITYQNLFRMYGKLSGMTGTAKTEEEEFRGIYKLDVVTIPTNRPMIRKDLVDSVYINQRGKYTAVVEEVVRRHATGQPVLVGTVSVEKSELVSKMLERRGVKHNVLNAKFHEREAEIVAQAGKKNAVTISTNMAGRGTDILLGGNPEFMARSEMKRRGYTEELIEEAIGHAENVPDEVKEARAIFHELLAGYKKETDAEHEEVKNLGGLHILGTERHESRRIDNQLRGRAGRQGDPGSSQFFISLEDDLMRLFGSERIRPMIERMNAAGQLKEDEAMEYNILGKQIENAQKRIEGRFFDIRRNVLKFDDVMNQQREVIYSQRRDVIAGGDMRARINDMRRTLIEDCVKRFCSDEKNDSTWDIEAIAGELERICLASGQVKVVFDGLKNQTIEGFVDALEAESEKIYAAKEALFAENDVDMREVERVCLLRSVDRRWMDHIDAMDQLREGIGLRAYAQKDPVVEYKLEGYEMFEEMVHLIQEDTVRLLYSAMPARRLERKEVARPIMTSGGGAPQPKAPTRAAGQKVGNNDPCPCGSGKKYKNCCLGKSGQ